MALSLLDLPDELLVKIVEDYLKPILRVKGQRVWPASLVHLRGLGRKMGKY